MEVLVLHLPVKLLRKTMIFLMIRTIRETCAALGMIFFLRLKCCRILSRVVMQYIQLNIFFIMQYYQALAWTGEHFFYADPMEMLPRRARIIRNKDHLKSVRQQWYACSCCYLILHVH